MLRGWGQDRKVTVKDWGRTQSIPGPAQGLVQQQLKSRGLCWGLSQTAGLEVSLSWVEI